VILLILLIKPEMTYAPAASGSYGSGLGERKKATRKKVTRRNSTQTQGEKNRRWLFLPYVIFWGVFFNLTGFSLGGFFHPARFSLGGFFSPNGIFCGWVFSLWTFFGGWLFHLRPFLFNHDGNSQFGSIGVK